MHPHVRPMVSETRMPEPRRPRAEWIDREPVLGHGLDRLHPVMPAPRGRGMGIERVFHERVPRPSQIAKWVGKKFSGSGDPHSHVASFVQVMEAENIEEFRTQYQAFGLTLEGNAADWFQSLHMDEFHDLATFFEEFTQEFSKRGIKHNTFSLIYDFKQEAGE